MKSARLNNVSQEDLQDKYGSVFSRIVEWIGSEYFIFLHRRDLS